MKKKKKFLVLILVCVLLLVFLLFFIGFPKAQDVTLCIHNPVSYGFSGGFWHGLIAFISFVGSLFSNDIAIWAINNNGGWYSLGFLLGVLLFNSLLRAVLLTMGIKISIINFGFGYRI
jgi:hypothetical protein